VRLPGGAVPRQVLHPVVNPVDDIIKPVDDL
jgi:hypothetical protein